MGKAAGSAKPAKEKKASKSKSNALKPAQPAPRTAPVHKDLVALLEKRVGLPRGEPAHQAIQAVRDFVDGKLDASVIEQLFHVLEHGTTLGGEEGDEGSAGEESGEEDEFDRVVTIFKQLTEMEQDAERRGWRSKNEMPMIIGLLTELQNAFSEAEQDSPVLGPIMEDDFENVTTLIRLFESETEVELRSAIVKVFGVMAQAVRPCLRVMVESALVNALGQGLSGTFQHSDPEFMLYSLYMLTMLCGQCEQSAYLDSLDGPVVSAAFEAVDKEDEEELAEAAQNFLLALNSAYDGTDSQVMILMRERADEAPGEFAQRVLKIVNRDEDPVGNGSALRFIRDLFSRKDTAEWFYTNDLMMLIDVALRELKDLEETDVKREVWIQVIDGLLENSNYSDHSHRKDEIGAILQDLGENEAFTPRARALAAVALKKL